MAELVLSLKLSAMSTYVSESFTSLLAQIRSIRPVSAARFSLRGLQVGVKSG